MSTQVEKFLASKSIGSEKLTHLVTEMRARCRFSASAEAFLDFLLERADGYTNVLFSEKQKTWFLELLNQAKARGAQI